MTHRCGPACPPLLFPLPQPAAGPFRAQAVGQGQVEHQFRLQGKGRQEVAVAASFPALNYQKSGLLTGIPGQ